jgi:hypothetical protein
MVTLNTHTEFELVNLNSKNIGKLGVGGKKILNVCIKETEYDCVKWIRQGQGLVDKQYPITVNKTLLLAK